MYAEMSLTINVFNFLLNENIQMHIDSIKRAIGKLDTNDTKT